MDTKNRELCTTFHGRLNAATQAVLTLVPIEKNKYLEEPAKRDILLEKWSPEPTQKNEAKRYTRPFKKT